MSSDGGGWFYLFLTSTVFLRLAGHWSASISRRASGLLARVAQSASIHDSQSIIKKISILMWVFSRRKFFSGHAEETRKIVSSRWNWRILEKSGKRYSLCNRTGTDREHSRQRWIRGRARDQQRSQHHLQLLMETDHISRLLARDLLMCHYEVVAKDTLPEVVSTEPSAFGCNTHDGDQPGDQLRRFALAFIHSQSGATVVFWLICRIVYIRFGAKK